MHRFTAAQCGDEVAPGLAPGGEQRIVAGDAVVVGRQVVRAPTPEVAPERAARGVQEEVLFAGAGLTGDHLQYVGRDVLAGKHEQPRRQAGGRRSVVRGEALQVVADAPGAMRTPAGDAPPQLRLRDVAIGTVLPAQQQVATPGLVFLETVGQRTCQRPGLAPAVPGRAAIGKEAGVFTRRVAAQFAQQVPAQDIRT